MLESQLFQYGVLGTMLFITLAVIKILFDRLQAKERFYNEKTTKVIEQNTIALTTFTIELKNLRRQ